MVKLHRLCAAQARVYCERACVSFSCCNSLLWPCLEEEREYKSVEKGSAKSKYRRPLKLTLITTEATGYSERTLRRIVAEKYEISGA